MKRKIVNNIKIINIIICLIVLLALITILLIFDNFNIQMFILALLMAIIIFHYVSALNNDLLNIKLTKKLLYGLKNCDFFPYILELEKELKITDKNQQRYYELKYSLIIAKFFQYGPTSKISQELKAFPIERLNEKYLLGYNNTLITLLANEKKINEAYCLLNDLKIKYPCANLNSLEQGIILMSEEPINQENALLKIAKDNKKNYKYNYVGSVCNLGTYYYKIKDYEKAYACFKYVNDNSNTIYLTKSIKQELKMSKLKASRMSNLYNEINIDKFGNNMKNTIITYIRSLAWIIIIIILFHKYYTINKQVHPNITTKDFVTYMEDICPVSSDKNNIQNFTDIKNIYSTDENCEYDVNYIKFNNKVQYKQVVDKLRYTYNLKIKDKSTNYNTGYITLESNRSLNKYYAKIYIQNNILIYIVGKDNAKEKIEQIINDLSNY